MVELYMLRDLIRRGKTRQRSAKNYLRYAIAVALVEQELHDLKRVEAWMRTLPRFRWHGGPVKRPRA
jgi:hypothetical protein